MGKLGDLDTAKYPRGIQGAKSKESLAFLACKKVLESGGCLVFLHLEVLACVNDGMSVVPPLSGHPHLLFSNFLYPVLFLFTFL